MQKQSRINQFRTEFHKQIRRDNINRLFNQNRQAIKQQNNKLQEEEFNRIYPNIDEHNFQHNIQFLLKYSYNQNFNYRLVVFGGYLYEYLLKNRTSIQALQIFEALSQFQELQIPQTQELVDILIENLSNNCKNIFCIVANLLQYYKYCSCLRDYLIQRDFIGYGQKTLQAISKQVQQQKKQLLTQLFVYILSSMISSHPLIDEEIFNEIINKILYYLADNDLAWFLIDSLNWLVSTIEEKNPIFLLIYTTCNNVLLKNYYNYQWQIVNILYFCIRSHIIIENNFYPLFVKSLISPHPNITQRIILICQQIMGQKQTEMCESGPDLYLQQNFVNNMMKIYEISSERIKIKIVKILKAIIVEFIPIIFQNQSINNYSFDIFQFSTIVKSGLQSKNVQLLQSTIEVILCVVQAIQSQQQQNKSHFLESFEQKGIFQILTNLQMQNKQLKKKIQCILYFQKKVLNL